MKDQNMLKGVLLAVVALIVIPIVISAAKESSDRDRVQHGDDQTAAIQVTSDQLHADYKFNEVRADQMYRGKVLIVAGAVRAIRKNFSDHPYLELWTTNEFEGVRAEFQSESSLASLKPGQHVTVRCIGDNVFAGSPQLKDCVLD